MTDDMPLDPFFNGIVHTGPPLIRDVRDPSRFHIHSDSWLVPPPTEEEIYSARYIGFGHPEIQRRFREQGIEVEVPDWDVPAREYEDESQESDDDSDTPGNAPGFSDPAG